MQYPDGISINEAKAAAARRRLLEQHSEVPTGHSLRTVDGARSVEVELNFHAWLTSVADDLATYTDRLRTAVTQNADALHQAVYTLEDQDDMSGTAANTVGATIDGTANDPSPKPSTAQDGSTTGSSPSTTPSTGQPSTGQPSTGQHSAAGNL